MLILLHLDFVVNSPCVVATMTCPSSLENVPILIISPLKMEAECVSETSTALLISTLYEGIRPDSTSGVTYHGNLSQ
jgi:hypothetical protein